VISEMVEVGNIHIINYWEKISSNCVGFEVLREVTIKNTVFWDVVWLKIKALEEPFAFIVRVVDSVLQIVIIVSNYWKDILG
jgi:hypothetical protein